MPRVVVLVGTLVATAALAGCSYTNPSVATNSPTNSIFTQLSTPVATANSATPDQHSAKATGTTKTTSATSTGPTGTWSKSTAATHLSAYVAPPETALNKLSAMSPNAPIGQAQQALSNLAGALSTMIDKLKTGSWPSSATTKINTLVSTASHERDLIAELATKSSIAAMQQQASELASALGAEESALAAAKLAVGLPAK
jgi:hypothetical protein